MRLSEKPNQIKRVFVSIRDNKSEQIKKLSNSKPPLQPSKFIRKKTETSRSHTPEQHSSRPASIVPKTSSRKSLSPYTSASGLLQEANIPCKNYSNLLSIHQITNEDSLCMPYELETEKPKHKPVRGSSKSALKKVDLTPGIFSQKQIVSESFSKKEKENSRFFTYSGFHPDESTTVASRTPSPVLPPRNNRCSALSRNFKINKQIFAQEVEKQGKNEEVNPWGSIMSDLEPVLSYKDLSPHPSTVNKRVPIKLTRSNPGII
jgi:hypothetical protein